MTAVKSAEVLTARVYGITYSLPTEPGAEVYSHGFEDYAGTTIPAATAYSQNFDGFVSGTANPDGWLTTVTGGTVSGNQSNTAAFYRQAGAGGWWVGHSNLPAAGSMNSKRTVTGLTVGRSYTFTAYGRPAHASLRLRAGVTGIGMSGQYNPGVNTWGLVSYSFVATATSHELVLTMDNTSAGTLSASSAWDTLTLTRNAYIDITNPGLGGWAADANSKGTVDPNAGRGGTKGLQAERLTGTGQVAHTRTFTGLLVGRSYTLSAWFWNWDDRIVNAKVGVTGKGYGTSSDGSFMAYAQVSYTFTATATSHEALLEHTSNGTPTAAYTVVWDDITLTRADYTPTLPYLPLKVINGNITLDSETAPYADARVTVALPEEDYLEQLNPIDGLRLQLTAEQEWVFPLRAPVTRTFDLYLQKVNAVAEGGALELTAVSDEALLIDGGHLGATVDTSAEANQTSLRAIINGVLSGYSTSLEAGTDDADFTITSNRTNLMPNPNVRTAVGSWIAGGSNGTLTRQTGLTGGPVPGVTTYTRTTWTGASGDGAGGAFGQTATVAPTLNVNPNTVYRLSVWVRSNVAKTLRFMTQTYTSAGAVVSGGDLLATATLVANTWTRVTGTITTGATVGRLGPYIYANTGSQWASGNTFDTLGWTVTQTADDVASFDGSSSDAYYTYAWTGTANASSSTRTRLDNRSPDLLKLEPGQTFWDFLDPLIKSVGLRLWCDEQRRWYLTEAESELEGLVTVSEGFNATSGTDSRDLRSTNADGSPINFTGVVVRYRWTDTAGVEQTRYDYAGTNRKVWRLELDRPYPGPGRAQTLLNQAEGRGRTQELAALMDLSTSPRMALKTVLPGVPVQTGRVARVTFLFDSEGEQHGLMTVGSRGLVETPANAWLFALGDWNAATGTWSAATGTN